MGAGRWLERRAPDRSARFYEAALRAGLPDALEPGVAWRLGWLWRRAGRVGDARTLWAETVARAERPPLRLLIDLAKLHEHHARDYGAALDLDAGRPAGSPRRGSSRSGGLVEALERRAHRLTRRLARRMAAGGRAGDRRRADLRAPPGRALRLVHERERHDVEQVRHDADARPHGVERRRWLDGMDPRPEVRRSR